MHFHTDYLHYPASRRRRLAQVTTLHGRLDAPELGPLYREFGDMPVVSISDAQRRPLPWADWQATVHHGLPAGLFRFRPGPGKYFAFVGRISPEKRVDRAIEIARRAGRTIRIAAKVDRSDSGYFDAVVEPLLHHPLVEFLGEVGDAEKDDLLGNACALLFPIDWPEPFGLAMIEAMVCSTPVIAYRHGSVPEVIEHGRSGFIVAGLDEAADAARRVHELSRRRCRECFELRVRIGGDLRDPAGAARGRLVALDRGLRSRGGN